MKPFVSYVSILFYAESDDEREESLVGREESMQEELDEKVQSPKERRKAQVASAPVQRMVKRVDTLTELCIATCAQYVNYLPELPEGV